MFNIELVLMYQLFLFVLIMILISFIIGYIIAVIGGFITRDKGHSFIDDGDILGIAILVNILFIWFPIYYLLDYLVYG